LTDIISDAGSLTDWSFGDAGATPPAFKIAVGQSNGSLAGGLLSGRIGAIQQINISVGAVPREGKWNYYGRFVPAIRFAS
jgi:hypothetical protein